MTTIQDLLPAVAELTAGTDWISIAKCIGLIALVLCALGAILRCLFGKGSALVGSISACINVGIIYLISIAVYALIPQLREIFPSLPFLTVTEEAAFLWDIAALELSDLYPQLLRLFLLGFWVNLLETLAPKGKKMLSWYGFRLLNALVCLCIYCVCCALIDEFIPKLFGIWAGHALLGLWAFILMIGIIQVILSVVLTVINPIIGAIYTFFFSNLLGKQFSKSILTTVLTSVSIFLLHRSGFVELDFSQFSLISFGPVCLILLLAWLLFGKLL